MCNGGQLTSSSPSLAAALMSTPLRSSHETCLVEPMVEDKKSKSFANSLFMLTLGVVGATMVITVVAGRVVGRCNVV